MKQATITALYASSVISSDIKITMPDGNSVTFSTPVPKDSTNIIDTVNELLKIAKQHVTIHATEGEILPAWANEDFKLGTCFPENAMKTTIPSEKDKRNNLFSSTINTLERVQKTCGILSLTEDEENKKRLSASIDALTDAISNLRIVLGS